MTAKREPEISYVVEYLCCDSWHRTSEHDTLAAAQNMIGGLMTTAGPKLAARLPRKSYRIMRDDRIRQTYQRVDK